MTDPVIQWLLHPAFSLLFLGAGLYKLRNRLRFQGIIAAYRLTPGHWAAPLAMLIGLLETGLGIGWLSGGSVLVPLLSASLLGVYALAIIINLLRGRTYIDCGCGFSLAAAGEDAGIRQLSPGLVARNGVLILLALVAALPATERALGVMDYAGTALGLAAMLLLYAAANQLLANHNAIGAWRNTHG